MSKELGGPGPTQAPETDLDLCGFKPQHLLKKKIHETFLQKFLSRYPDIKSSTHAVSVTLPYPYYEKWSMLITEAYSYPKIFIVEECSLPHTSYFFQPL